MPKLTLMTLMGTTVLGAGSALAQTQPARPPFAAFDTTTLAPDDALRSSTWAIPVARPAIAAQVQPGAVVRGNDGRYLGRISAVEGTRVMIQHSGDRTAVVPLRELWDLDGGLMLQMSRNSFTHWAASQGGRH